MPLHLQLHEATKKCHYELKYQCRRRERRSKAHFQLKYSQG